MDELINNQEELQQQPEQEQKQQEQQQQPEEEEEEEARPQLDANDTDQAEATEAVEDEDVEEDDDEDEEDNDEENDPLVVGALAAKASGSIDEWVRYLDETDPSHRLRSLCKKGNLEALTGLLESHADGLDIDAVSDEGWTCLHEIITHECQFTTVAEILVQHGANVNTQDLNGDTPLHSALLYHNESNISLLLKAKADLTILNNSGRTPVHTADAVDTLKLLLDAGANVDLQDQVGNTPLHYAVAAKDKERVQLLLKHSPDLNLANQSGSTALHLAVGDIEIMTKLLAAGASPNRPDVNGNSPLHLAARGRHKDVARMMLEHSADVSLMNSMSKTPLNLAKDKEMKNIILRKNLVPKSASPVPLGSGKKVKKVVGSTGSQQEFLEKLVKLPECESPSILKKRKRTFSDDLDAEGTPMAKRVGPRLRFSEVNDYSGVEVIAEEKRVKVCPIYSELHFSSDDD